MTSNSVAIIDTDCNLHSVIRACKYVGLNPIILGWSKIIACDGAILPGVGALVRRLRK